MTEQGILYSFMLESQGIRVAIGFERTSLDVLKKWVMTWNGALN